MKKQDWIKKHFCSEDRENATQELAGVGDEIKYAEYDLEYDADLWWDGVEGNYQLAVPRRRGPVSFRRYCDDWGIIPRMLGSAGRIAD